MGEDGRTGRAVVPLPRRETAAETGLGQDVVPQVREALEILTEACGDNLLAVLFFGSVLVGTSPNQDSAADLFVVVEDYRRFYRDVGYRLPAARSTSVMVALNKVLPPNIIYLRNPGDLRAGAKCFIMSREAFAIALSGDARDNFCRGRLTQRVQIVYSRSAEMGKRSKTPSRTRGGWRWSGYRSISRARSTRSSSAAGCSRSRTGARYGRRRALAWRRCSARRRPIFF